MSEALKLKECIAEYRKANKELDDELTKIEEHSRQTRQEQEEQSNRQS